jgi:hypothetical protein
VVHCFAQRAFAESVFPSFVSVILVSSIRLMLTATAIYSEFLGSSVCKLPFKHLTVRVRPVPLLLLCRGYLIQSGLI